MQIFNTNFMSKVLIYILFVLVIFLPCKNIMADNNVVDMDDSVYIQNYIQLCDDSSKDTTDNISLNVNEKSIKMYHSLNINEKNQTSIIGETESLKKNKHTLMFYALSVISAIIICVLLFWLYKKNKKK